MAKRKPDSPTSPATPTAETPGYTVLARRYRPQLFGDLVGQEAVAQALSNALQSGRVAHAYLFTGARGVGKTSTARILAKALNCEKGPTITPCGTCDICRSIAAGEDLDVLEIDGASNRGIDEVRAIRQNVQCRPARARYKIYIIDEVHMLTPPAFNALLKTLEEPPPHVKFLFATTEVQKIPITILSRCQRFDFAGIGTPQIVNRLREIVASEGMAADDEALEMIARRAGGSMRDAQSLLDQLLAFGGERLTVDQVHRLLGTARGDAVSSLAEAVIGRDAKKALELLSKGANEGLQLGELIDQLIDYWRDLMVVNCAGAEAQALSVSGGQREQLSKQAAALRLDSILAGLDVLASTKARLRISSHDRVLVEMALVRLSRLEDLVSLSQLAQWLRQPVGSAPIHRGTADSAPMNRGTTNPPARSALPATRLADDDAAKKKAPEPEQSPAPAHVPLSPESLTEIWQTVLAQLGPLVAGDLGRADTVAISGPNSLAIRFAPQYNLLREQFQDPKLSARIEEVLAKVTGHVCSVRIELGAEPATTAPRMAEQDAAQAAAHQRRQHSADVAQLPLMKQALDVLGAQVVRMDDGFGAAANSNGSAGHEE